VSDDKNVPVRTPTTSTALESRTDALGLGRLGTYSMLGAAIASMPLPILPGSLAMRMRGALVHDVCASHGLSITPEARRLLAKPGLAEGPEGLIGAAVRFATSRVFSRLGPLTVLPPIRSGLLTFAIGHLLARYLATRTSRSVRIDVDEARRVRLSIERAITLTISTPARSERDVGTAPEELRDQLTQLTDGVFAGLASLPGHLVRRLEAAFDDQMQT
jgi:hypothetical protein